MAYVYKGKLKEPEPLAAPTCGTDYGYHQHGQLGTPACQPCKDAHAAAYRKWRRRPTMSNSCGTYRGYMRHKRAEEDACEYCLAGYAQYMRDYRRLAKAGQLLADGASQREVQRTTGLARETIRKHFPGKGWTFRQGGEFRALQKALDK